MNMNVKPEDLTAAVDSTDGTARVNTIAFHISVFLAAFLVVFSRRPDAILNAQFWAEDGKFWYADAYHFGLHSLLMAEAGYLHTLPRIVALFTLLFPLAVAPLVMNLCAIVMQILPVNLFLSSRFSSISMGTRLLGSLLYLVLPNSFEIHANSTNIQWHLALVGCLVLLAARNEERTWRILDLAILALVAIDSPLGIPLIPIAALLWWQRRDVRSKLSLAMLIPGTVFQIVAVLLSHSRRSAPNGATLTRLTSILGGQVFLSSVLGLRTFIQFYFVQHLRYLFVIEAISLIAGLAIILYAFRYAPTELKLFILFATLVLGMALSHPLASMESEYPQWDLMQIPGIGNRYYFFPMLALLASVVWMLKSSAFKSRIPRYAAVLFLSLLLVGIYRDFEYRPYTDLQFQRFAAEFDRTAPGTQFAIPLNPVIQGYDWTMQLTKR